MCWKSLSSCVGISWLDRWALWNSVLWPTVIKHFCSVKSQIAKQVSKAGPTPAQPLLSLTGQMVLQGETFDSFSCIVITESKQGWNANNCTPFSLQLYNENMVNGGGKKSKPRTRSKEQKCVFHDFFFSKDWVLYFVYIVVIGKSFFPYSTKLLMTIIANWCG